MPLDPGDPVLNHLLHATHMPPHRQGVGPSCVGVPGGSWAKAIDFLAERFPRIARSEWLSRMQAGLVFDAAGEPLPPDAPFTPNTQLYYYRSLAHEPRIPFDEQVLYQDEHIVIADKPHFLPVTPSGRYLQETLLVRLKRKLGIATLAPVHRIDRETAGLVLLSTQPETRGMLQAMFRERRVHKCYEAMASHPGGLTFPLMRESRLVEAGHFMQMREIDGTPNSQTRIEHVETKGEWSRYRLWPLSGKRHQLRVHMAALGLPIVGDKIYPTLWAEEAEPSFDNPLRLLALELGFEHPVTGRTCLFKSEQRLEWPPASPPALPRVSPPVSL